MTTSKDHKILKAIILVVGILKGVVSMVFAQEQVIVIGEKDEMQTLFAHY